MELMTVRQGFNGAKYYFCTMRKIEIANDMMHFGLYLCTQGYCEMEINERRCTIHRGMTFVKSPLVRIGNISASDDFEYTAIIEDEITVFAPIASKNFDMIQNLLQLNIYNLLLEETEQAFLLHRKDLIEKRKKELNTEEITIKQQKIITDIIVMLEQVTILEYARIFLKREDMDISESNKENDLMIRFLFLVFRKFHLHRDVKFYAECLHLSPNHFTRIIKKTSHRTPSEWITLVTINQAKKLLRQRDKNIKEVARELNFPEQFTFRKYFKQHTGLSPTEYKKNN